LPRYPQILEYFDVALLSVDLLSKEQGCSLAEYQARRDRLLGVYRQAAQESLGRRNEAAIKDKPGSGCWPVPAFCRWVI